jgi:dynactin complex subunit
MTHGTIKDIVERLRKQAGWHIDNQKMVTGPLLDEAADEIEKLRAQVVSLQSSLDAAPEHTRLGKKKTPDALEKP